ncbi:MAG: histidine phosphatase family protein [Acidimicrobiales bacterium]
MASAPAGGFERLITSPPSSVSPPPGISTQAPAGSAEATRLVLIRHGEAECNVSGVCGGAKGCTGLTSLGVLQVRALRERLEATGELAGADALYASVLPRAVESAELLAPALRSIAPDGSAGPPPRAITDCTLCELHPGEADGLTWGQFTGLYGGLDWDRDPDRPIAPGGESWTGFVLRVAGALENLVDRHPGGLVVVACHAGVIEASLLSMLPILGGRRGARLQLRTRHASLTRWEVDEGRWHLTGFNDAAHLATSDPSPAPASALVPALDQQA